MTTTETFDFHRSSDLIDRFEQIVIRYAERPAVRHVSSLTYGQLKSESDRIAIAIAQLHGSTQDPVALLLDHGCLMIAAVFGVLKSGKFYVPIDPQYPVHWSLRISNDAAPKLLLTNNANWAFAKKLFNANSVLNLETFQQTRAAKLPVYERADDRLAYILYTSGTTGLPKGVMQNHRNVLNDIQRLSRDLQVTPDDRFGLIFSYCSSTSVSHIFGALLNGASLHLFDPRKESFHQMTRWMRDEKITILDINPTTFRHFISTLDSGDFFPDVRMLCLGGEGVSPEDVEAYRKFFSDGCVLQNGYGTTETRTITQSFMNKRTSLDDAHVSIGYPVDGKEVLLLDEQGQEARYGEVGEIAVRSAYLSPGYWRDVEKTRKRFSVDPSDEHKRIYRTGDLGRKQEDGKFIYLGRKDFQVKIRGHKVELESIEALLQTHMGVQEARVIAHGAANGENRLIAYVVPRAQAVLGIADMREMISAKLPPHMIPSRFELVSYLPKTPGGKIDLGRLKLISQLTDPHLAGPLAEDAILLAIVSIWSELLGRHPVGIQDNFFEMGGDSLAATSLVSRIFTQFGLQLPVRLIFERPTINGLTEFIRSHLD